MLMALWQCLQGRWGDYLRGEMLADSVTGLTVVRDQIWRLLCDWLFTALRTAGANPLPGVSDGELGIFETRLRAGATWTAATGGLALVQYFRLEWLWRLICWGVRRVPALQVGTRLDVIEHHCEQHTTPLHWDCVIEVEFRRDSGATPRLSRLRYRPRDWDDFGDIIVRIQQTRIVGGAYGTKADSIQRRRHDLVVFERFDARRLSAPPP